jgi:hypothetical protein
MNLFKMDESHVGLYKALVLNFIIGLMSFSNIEMVLKIVLLIVSIGYTVFKFCEDYKKSKNEKRN